MDAQFQREFIKGGAFLISEDADYDIFTPEDFTDEHRMIGETIREFVDVEVRPAIPKMEKHDWEAARRLIRKAGELGLLGADLDNVVDNLPNDCDWVPVGEESRSEQVDNLSSRQGLLMEDSIDWEEIESAFFENSVLNLRPFRLITQSHIGKFKPINIKKSTFQRSRRIPFKLNKPPILLKKATPMRI